MLIESNPDALFSTLRSKGYTGASLDMLNTHLADRGYTGSLPDKVFAWRTAKGTINQTVDEWSAGLAASTIFPSLLLQPNALNVAPWTASNTTVTPNSAVAPDGTTTADTITDNSASFGTLSQTGLGALTVNLPYTFILYVLKDAVARTTRFAIIRGRMTTGSVITNVDLLLDTSTGEFATIDISGIGYTINASVTLVGSWWRVVLRLQNATRYASGMEIYPAAGAGASLVLGGYNAATTGSITAWGAQLYTQ